MAVAGAVGGQAASDKVMIDFAQKRYEKGGITQMVNDMSVAGRVVAEVNSNPVGRALIKAALKS